MLHQPRRRVAQAQRHRPRSIVGDEGAGGVVGNVNRVALGRAGEVDDRLGQRELAFGCSQALKGRHRVERDLKGTRVREADILTCHAYHAPADIEWIGTAVEHAAEPVQRCVRVGAAHRFVQGRDLIIESFSALVEAAHAAGDRCLDERQVDVALAHVLRRDAELLHQIEQAPSIAVGVGNNRVARRRRERGLRHRDCERALKELRQLIGVKRLEHIYRCPGQQCAVDLEGWVLGGRTDEGHQSLLDIGKKRVLLRFVEAVDFVDEKDGMAARLCKGGLGAGDGIPNVLDPGQHRRQGDEVGIERVGHQSRQGRLADAGRTPQDHRVRLTGRECNGQRLARCQEVALSDDFAHRPRSQPFGQRRGRIGDREKISFHSGSAQSPLSCQSHPRRAAAKIGKAQGRSPGCARTYRRSAASADRSCHAAPSFAVDLP